MITPLVFSANLGVTPSQRRKNAVREQLRMILEKAPEIPTVICRLPAGTSMRKIGELLRGKNFDRLEIVGMPNQVVVTHDPRLVFPEHPTDQTTIPWLALSEENPPFQASGPDALVIKREGGRITLTAGDGVDINLARVPVATQEIIDSIVDSLNSTM